MGFALLTPGIAEAGPIVLKSGTSVIAGGFDSEESVETMKGKRTKVYDHLFFTIRMGKRR
jgi:hypothetical protein